MKRLEEVVQFIAHRIGYIYHHQPLMYGGTADGVDLILHYYHELWAEIVERTDDYFNTCFEIHRQEDCNSHNFASRYRVAHPDATELGAAEYVVSQWRRISDLLGVPIPHGQIIEELEKQFGPKGQCRFRRIT